MDMAKKNTLELMVKTELTKYVTGKILSTLLFFLLLKAIT